MTQHSQPATLLALLVHQRGWTVARFIRAFDETAAALKTDIRTTDRTVRRWLSGTGNPLPPARLVLEAIFDRPSEELLAPPPTAALRSHPAMTHQTSLSASAPGLTLAAVAPPPPGAVHETDRLQRRPGDRSLPTLRQEQIELPADVGLERLWTPAGLATAFEELASVTAAPLERRQFLALSGAALTAAAHEWLVSDPARLAASLTGKTADSALVGDLTAGVDLLRRLDDKLGGQAIHGMVTEQFRLVVGVLRNAHYTQADGRSLYAIAAELARLAGWTSYDAGHHGTAQRYYLLGLRAAREADAPAIGANILRCMSEQATGSDDHHTAVDLLRSARAGARDHLTATERAILAGHLAMAYGRADEPEAAYTAADEAQQYIAESQPEDDPPYLYWAGPHIVALSVGSALLAAGRPQSAIPHLRSSVSGTPADSPRDLFSHKMKLARAYARAGNPDEAVHLVHRAIQASPVPVTGWVSRHFADACQDIRAAGHPGTVQLADHARALSARDVQ